MPDDSPVARNSCASRPAGEGQTRSSMSPSLFRATQCVGAYDAPFTAARHMGEPLYRVSRRPATRIRAAFWLNTGALDRPAPFAQSPRHGANAAAVVRAAHDGRGYRVADAVPRRRF